MDTLRDGLFMRPLYKKMRGEPDAALAAFLDSVGGGLAEAAARDAALGDFPSAFGRVRLALLLLLALDETGLFPVVRDSFVARDAALLALVSGRTLARVDSLHDDAGTAYKLLSEAVSASRYPIPRARFSEARRGLLARIVPLAIAAGEVVEGMTREDVLSAAGEPKRVDTVYSVTLGNFGEILDYGDERVFLVDDVVAETW